MPRVRVHRIAHSTNVERVAIAAGLKEIVVDWVDHLDADRREVIALSGQSLVPVAEIEAEVVIDSVAIMRRLELLGPEPRLWPEDPAARAAVELFIDWFNESWKRAPNLLAADPARADAADLRRAIAERTGWIENLLGTREWLAGSEPTAADVCAYPFLRYASHEPDRDDPDPFHRVLADCLPGSAGARLRAWIEAIDAWPRA